MGREGRKEEDATRTRGGEEEGFWVEVEVEERKGKAAQGRWGKSQSTGSLATCGVRASAARLSDTHSHIPPLWGNNPLNPACSFR